MHTICISGRPGVVGSPPGIPPEQTPSRADPPPQEQTPPGTRHPPLGADPPPEPGTHPSGTRHPPGSRPPGTRHSTPLLTESQMPIKTLPCPNFVAGDNNRTIWEYSQHNRPIIISDSFWYFLDLGSCWGSRMRVSTQCGGPRKVSWRPGWTGTREPTNRTTERATLGTYRIAWGGRPLEGSGSMTTVVLPTSIPTTAKVLPSF